MCCDFCCTYNFANPREKSKNPKHQYTLKHHHGYSSHSHDNISLYKFAFEILFFNYSKTIFKVESMELASRSSNSIVYSICVSKEGVIQEPNRSIYLELKDGMWQVVNEGY